MQFWWDRYNKEEREILTPLYESLREFGMHWGPEGFDMERINRIFDREKWHYDIKESPGGYEAMAQLRFDPDATDYGMGEGHLPEIAILRGLELALRTGFAKGAVKQSED